MASKFFFGGNLYSTPVTASQVNDTGFAPATLGLGQQLAYIGNSYGGQPNTIITGDSPADFEGTLISGDLMTMVNKAFAPSTQVGTPSKLTVVVVGQATQATGVINGTGASGAIIDLTSTQYGLPANLTKVKVEAGSNSTQAAPSFKVSCGLGSNVTSEDNLYRLAFSVAYAGSQATATVNVGQSQLVLSAPAGTAVATIAFNSTLTVDQLVDQINGVPGFVAAIGPDASGTPTLNALENSVGGAKDCKTAPYMATATVQAIVDWMNSPANGLVTGVNTSTAGTLPALVGWTFLTGAAAPAPVVQDWANALAVLQNADCQHVGVLSADEAVWAAADAHVQYMSSVGRKERRAYYGPALGTSVAAVAAMPIDINSDRSAICFPGYQDYDVNGNLVTLPSYFTAGMIAAGFAGSSPGDAMTNKVFAVRGLELILRNPTDTDLLIQAGVCCMESTDEGYKCVRSISTWLVNDNFNRVEISCGIAVDYTMRTIRAAVDQARGGRQGPQLLGLALSIAKSTLLALSVPQPTGPGVLVGDANSPAFTDPTGSIAGDQLLISFTCSPVIPNNFIGVTANLQAYSGTASA